MTFNLQNFEFYLLILVRITGFIFTAPFFSLREIPFKVKTGISIFLALILYNVLPVDIPVYAGVIGYAVLVVKEAIAGAIMGLFANIAYYILDFAGQMMDMEIGFSMVNELDPITNLQTTITANFYGYLVLLMMMVTNLHHYFIKALVDSFQVFGVGDAFINPDLYKVMVHFIADYFIIAFRIILPVFASILIVNVILAILAKVAPQMNMFVIGMQLKIMIGLIVLVLIISLIPSVSDFIYREMMDMLRSAIQMMKPGR